MCNTCGDDNYTCEWSSEKKMIIRILVSRSRKHTKVAYRRQLGTYGESVYRQERDANAADGDFDWDTE